jgi:hypothetical protein
MHELHRIALELTSGACTEPGRDITRGDLDRRLQASSAVKRCCNVHFNLVRIDHGRASYHAPGTCYTVTVVDRTSDDRPR